MQHNEPVPIQQPGSRASWARSTDTPLRFFVHLMFVIEGSLGSVLVFGMRYKADPSLLLYVTLALIGLAILAICLVFILVVFFPKNLVFDKEAHLINWVLEYGDESKIVAYSKIVSAPSMEAPPLLPGPRTPHA